MKQKSVNYGLDCGLFSVLEPHLTGLLGISLEHCSLLTQCQQEQLARACCRVSGAFLSDLITQRHQGRLAPGGWSIKHISLLPPPGGKGTKPFPYHHTAISRSNSRLHLHRDTAARSKTSPGSSYHTSWCDHPAFRWGADETGVVKQHLCCQQVPILISTWPHHIQMGIRFYLLRPAMAAQSYPGKGWDAVSTSYLQPPCALQR